MHFNMLEFPFRKKANNFTVVSVASYCFSIVLLFFFIERKVYVKILVIIFILCRTSLK